jgi:hypothetical protein
MDSLKGKNKKLFGRSFPENGGNLYNRIKHMKAKYMNKEKPNYDPRDIALLYTLNEGFKRGDYNTDEDGVSNYGESSGASSFLTDFDLQDDIKQMFMRIPNLSQNNDALIGIMYDLGVGPQGKLGASTSNAFKTYKSRQKAHLIKTLKRDNDPDRDRFVHEKIDETGITHNPDPLSDDILDPTEYNEELVKSYISML